MKSAVFNGVAACVGAVMLAGCGLSVREHRGYVIDEQLTSAVQDLAAAYQQSFARVDCS